ncbi:MAG: EAL domain-containing protein [Nitrosomonadales bacterium]|nr:EAL domain-containing protein [Nitrosomonadales bacterium]
MKQRARQLRQIFLVAMLLFVCGMFSITAYTLWRLHTDAIQSGLDISAMHTRAFEDFLTQNLHVTELVAANTLTQKDRPLAPRQIENNFVATLRHAPFLRSMSLLDERGRIYASSNPANVGIAVATRSYLPPAAATQEILRIGQPWAGRDFADGRASDARTPVEAEAQYFVPVTRTLLVGERAVTLLFALNPDYFVNHIAQKLETGEGTVEVLRYDGTLLMDTGPATSIGSAHEFIEQDMQLAEVESGKFEEIFGDGQHELTSYRASRLYPFVVVTHLHRSYALRQWQTEAKTLLGVVIPALLSIILLATAFYRRQMQIAAQRTEAERLQRINATVFDSSTESIIITDLNADIISVNPAFTRITGYRPEEVIGRNPRLLSSGKQHRGFYKAMWHDILQDGVWHGELINLHKNGSLYDIHMSITASRDGEGRLQHYIGVATDITERKRAERALRRESEKNKALLRNASDGIHILDTDGNIVEVSDSFCAMLGYRREEMTGMNLAQWDANFVGSELTRVFKQQFERKQRSEFETRHRRKDGTIFDVEVSGFPLELDGKQVVFNSSRDITARKRAEAELRIAASAFETQEGILITDADNTILRVNRAFTEISGYLAEDVIGKNPRILKSGHHDANFYKAMWSSIKSTGAWKGEIWNRRKNGATYPERLSITAVTDPNGCVTNYVASLADITMHKAAEEEIKSLAFYDPLTQLPNRRLLLDRLQQALVSSTRSGKEGALLFIDLDNFKTLNDTLGHDMGDMLLRQVSQRLGSCVRQGDTVARLGGDEFVVMLEDLSEESIEAAEQTETIGEKIIASLNIPYHLGEYEYHSTPSIGATLFNGQQQTIDELYKQADIAMYQSKKAGRNTLRFFDPQMQDVLNARTALESDLRKALEREQFSLYYQIQVDSSRRPFGAEVLIRWTHPERGLVSPAQFIPLAEETGLILQVGQWVLDTACAQLKLWEQDTFTRDLSLSVNVSAKQLHQTDFVAQVHATIRHHAIRPSLLKLEMTESMLQGNIEDTISIMNALKEIGIHFSLDDFGTGYSSLQYIKRLPLEQLKIDRSFVSDVVADSSDKAIVNTIIAMAHSMDLDVIAEGVETEAQRKFLLSHGCAHFQGYLFSKPVPIAQFEALLK